MSQRVMLVGGRGYGKAALAVAGMLATLDAARPEEPPMLVDPGAKADSFWRDQLRMVYGAAGARQRASSQRGQPGSRWASTAGQKARAVEARRAKAKAARRARRAARQD